MHVEGNRLHATGPMGPMGLAWPTPCLLACRTVKASRLLCAVMVTPSAAAGSCSSASSCAASAGARVLLSAAMDGALGGVVKRSTHAKAKRMERALGPPGGSELLLLLRL